jgi:CheY-like chemotaxis protein
VSERRGLGLGLVVVKQLTELHGGSVGVASEGQGRGTKFTIRIPMLPAGSIAAAASSAALFSMPRTSHPQRVLLVDDNQDALELLSTFVEEAGHEVVVAHDGREALAVLDRFQPSVAVIDIGMPVMSGYELAVQVRACPGDESPYLVALSGYGQATDRERSSAAGFDVHLVKPVNLDQLLRVIEGGRARSAAAHGDAG